jgi:hypothetical protein
MATFHVWSGTDTLRVRRISAASEAAVAEVFCGGQRLNQTQPSRPEAIRRLTEKALASL